MTPAEQASAADEFWRAAERFNEKAERLGYRDIRNYYWYHTVELPDGLITPGQYDFRQTIAEFSFPRDMRGLRVLDVGSATGFFAFDFARRGAQVISVELPTLEALDRFPGQPIEQILESIRRMMGPRAADLGGAGARYSAEEMYFYLLEGPFEFCRKQLGLAIQRCYATVYDLTEAKIGGAVDLAFLGDILLHTLNPLQALAAVAPLTRTLVLSQMVPEGLEERPAMAYVGGDSVDSDDVSWWLPNEACLMALLKKLGFGHVTHAGDHVGTMRPSGYVYRRPILLAEK
jgi:tRNA (mo5U34)-methyltransferase